MNNQMFFNTQLQWRLIVPLVMILVVSFSATIYVLAQEFTDFARTQVNEEEELLIASEEEALNLFLDGAYEDINFAANMVNLRLLADAIHNGDSDAILAYRELVEQDFLALSQERRIYNQIRFLDARGLEVVRVDYDGEDFRIVPILNLQNKSDRGYFQETIRKRPGEVYLSPLNLNREGTQSTIQGSSLNTIVPVLRYGVPIFENNDGETLQGIVVTNIFADELLELTQTEAEDAAHFLIDQNGYYLSNSRHPERVFGFEDGIETVGGVQGASISDDYNDDQITQFLGSVEVDDFETGNEIVHFTRIVPPGAGAGYFWVLANIRDQTAVFGDVNNITNLAIALTAGVLLLSVIAVVFITRSQVIGPIQHLSDTARAIAGGNFDQQVRPSVTRRADEIGVLGNGFNDMATQLKEFVSELEGRVDRRTRDLNAIIDVNNQIATVLNVDRVLQDVSDLTKERFGLYHAHIYILDENETLVLQAGAGYTGRQMVAEHRTIHLYSEQSLVAQAARSRQPVVIQDVSSNPNFLPHPLLPDTKSELAIALVGRGQLLGVLDVQSDQVDFFEEEVVSVLQTLASQIGTALYNAQLYEVAERTSRHEQALGNIERNIQGALDVDEVLKITARELGKALRVPHTTIELEMKSEGNGSSHE